MALPIYLIRGIQNLRKETGHEVTDRINLTVSGDSELEQAFNMFKDFISNETLAAVAEFNPSASLETKVEADDKTWSICIEKA